MQKPIVRARSKRSSKVALTTMVAIGGGVMLSACGDEPAAPSANATAKNDPQTEVQVYENVFACAKITGKTRQECETMREEALASAKEEAPRYEALQDCEAQYGAGQCVQNGGGEEQQARSGRSFSPFIVAWFSSSGNKNTPLFSSKAGGYQTANGSRLGYAGSPGKYYASNRAMERVKSVPKVKPASKLAKAGGFGDRSTGWNLSDRTGSASKSSSSSASARSRGG